MCPAYKPGRKKLTGGGIYRHAYSLFQDNQEIQGNLLVCDLDLKSDVVPWTGYYDEFCDITFNNGAKSVCVLN